jgi:hypothetical protein
MRRWEILRLSLVSSCGYKTQGSLTLSAGGFCVGSVQDIPGHRQQCGFGL